MAASGWGAQPRSLHADALLAELEQSSRPASKDSVLQMPSSCKQDPATVGPPAPCGREPLASGWASSSPLPAACGHPVPACPQGGPLSPAVACGERATSHGGGKGQCLLEGKVLNPGHPPALGLKPQHPSLSAVPSSPTPVPQPLIPSPPPTAAARQLDELLADLGHMHSKPSSGPRHPPSWQLAAVGQGAGVPGDSKPSLDNMLGSLTRDLQELGITATPASICATCHKPIAGKKVLTALDQTWHPEHFFCAHCGKVFGDDGMFQGMGIPPIAPFSSPAVFLLPALPPIPGIPCGHAPLQASPKVGAHPDALPAGFHERSGKPYCHRDFLAMFAPKCQGCDRPVTDNYLSALQGVWHPECFVCTECLSSFASGSFFELQGRPYCELHFHQRQGNICHGCSHPVTGRCITAAGRKYHPEHFICAYCLGQLQKGTFREHGDKMYCRACHDKLFL
uniref:Leupaxin n=1 Tax=Accipiter nisus TaxID=211598 RepID=A0A8B9NFA5_9AVES